jgi:hypothetical protein
MLIRHLWQLKRVVFLQWCLIHTDLLAEHWIDDHKVKGSIPAVGNKAKWRVKKGVNKNVMN